MRVISTDDTGAPCPVDVQGGYRDLIGAWREAQCYRELNPENFYIAGNLTGIRAVEAMISE